MYFRRTLSLPSTKAATSVADTSIRANGGGVFTNAVVTNSDTKVCTGLADLSLINVHSSMVLSTSMKKAENYLNSNNQNKIDLINYIAYKARMNEKPSSKEIQYLKLANESMDESRRTLNQIRTNVYSSQDPDQKRSNQVRLYNIRDADVPVYREIPKEELIPYDTACIKIVELGNCREYRSLTYMNFIKRMKSTDNVKIFAAQHYEFIEKLDHSTAVITYEYPEYSKLDASSSDNEVEEETVGKEETVSKEETVNKEEIVRKIEEASIIMDSWCYGPAVLKKDYTFNESVEKAEIYAMNTFEDQTSFDRLKEWIDKVELYKQKIESTIYRTPDYLTCEKKYNKEIKRRRLGNQLLCRDYGKHFTCKKELLNTRFTSFQDGIRFLSAAKDIFDNISIRDANKLYTIASKKINF